jgi:hypothetical protein
MTRRAVAPFVSGAVDRVVARPGSSYVFLTDDPATLGWTRLLIAAAGRVGGANHTTEFEFHTPQEEIFVLTGSVAFGDYYRADALAYLNHPPYWNHPAEQRFDPNVETAMLIRLSKPIDTAYVPIPPNWDGREFPAASVDYPRGPGISALQLDGLEYRPVLRNGAPSGEEAAVLWTNPVDGIVTCLWRWPAGWQGSGEALAVEGGYDELYALSGDLTTTYGGVPARLEATSYYCSPEVFRDGGASARSEGGMLAIRWLRPPESWTLPPILHDKLVT